MTSAVLLPSVGCLASTDIWSIDIDEFGITVECILSLSKPHCINRRYLAPPLSKWAFLEPFIDNKEICIDIGVLHQRIMYRNQDRRSLTIMMTMPSPASATTPAIIGVRSMIPAGCGIAVGLGVESVGGPVACVVELAGGARVVV